MYGKIMLEVFREEIAVLCAVFKKSLKICMAFAVFFWVVILAYIGNLNLMFIIPVTCILVFLSEYVRRLSNRLNNVTESGIPYMKKKLVKKSQAGLLYINNEDLEQAVSYLWELEKYLEGHRLCNFEENNAVK